MKSLLKALLAPLGLFLCLNAWADTWYVGAAASCPLNGDGTASTCAAESDGAGRWRGWGNINWTTGVDAGDTICHVGDNIVETGRLNVQDSGTLGSYIKITGDCADQTTRPRLATTGANAVIDVTDDNYIWLDYLDIVNPDSDATPAQTRGIAFIASTGDHAGIKVTRVRVTNALSTAATPNHCIWVSGSSTHKWSDVIFDDIETFACGAANTQNSDGLNIEDVTAGLVVTDIESYGNYNDGMDVSGGGTNPVISRVHVYDNGFSGAKFHCGTGVATGGDISAVISHDNGAWALIFQDWPSSRLHNSIGLQGTEPTAVRPTGITPFGALNVEKANTSTCTMTGNTYANLILRADYNAGVARIYDQSRADFETDNTWDAVNMQQAGAQTPLIYFTDDTENNVDIGADFTTWVETHTRDKSVDPLFVGGYSPRTTAGFRLSASSTLRRSGKELGPIQDHGNRAFLHPPSIGAWEAASGDQAVARTAASTRAAASARTAASTRTAR